MTSTGWSPLGFDIGPPEQEPRVMIAMPVYGGLNVEFAGTLLNCLSHLTTKGIRARVEFLQGDSLVPRARNNLAHQFLAHTKIPFLLQLDTDLVLDPEGIHRLICHPPELAVIGGCYPKKKTGPAEWVCNPVPGSAPDANGLHEVLEMGTGLLRIHRSVFAAIKAAYPQLTYICDGNHDERVDFFPVGTFPDPITKRTRYISEDWYICQLARAIGYKVWADTKCAARHIGQVAYPWPPPEPAEDSAVGRMFAEEVANLAPPCPQSANSPAPPTASPASTSTASTPPSPSSAPPAGPHPATSEAQSAGAAKQSSGRGRTRRRAATSAAS